MLDINAFYFSGSLTNSTTDSAGRSVYSGTLSFALDRKNTYFIGWSYATVGSTDSETSTKTYAASDMGPKFTWVLDKSRNWFFGAAYNLLANATYNDGSGSSEKWRGTSYLVELGYAPLVTEDFNLGLKFNYYAASYTEKLVGETTYSTVSNSQTMIYPSLFLAYLF